MLTQPRLLPRFCWLSISLILLSVSLFAQAPTGSISGTVHDATGAVVPNAAITLTNRDSGFIRNLLSAGDGSYNVAALPPGVYQVKSTVPGFRTVVREATVETGAITTV